MPGAHSAELWLTDILADNDYDLYLEDAELVGIGFSGWIANGDENICQAELPAGLYCIRLRREEGTSQTQPYALRRCSSKQPGPVA